MLLFYFSFVVIAFFTLLPVMSTVLKSVLIRRCILSFGWPLSVCGGVCKGGARR